MIVVLGSSGFIGRALIAQLPDARGFSSSELNLLQPSQLSALDPLLGPETTLIVCSALTPDRGQTLETLSANFSIALNLASCLHDKALRKVVYLSSDAVYPFVSEPVTEATPIDAANFYALGKIATERILLSTVQAPLLNLRPTGVYGPGDTHNSYGPNRFIRQIATDRQVRLFGQGEETRDHLFIDDLARLVASLIESDASGVLNLATGESRTFGSIIGDLRTFVPFEFEVVHAPRSGRITHRQFDISRLRQAIPDLQFTPFAEGLRRSFERMAVPT
jgi:UDP-glucose 4-epimerase